MADATCKSCIDDHWVEISHDNGANWHEVPAVIKSAKTFQDQTANTIRHSNSGKKKVSPCGSDSRTEVVTVDILFCDDDPVTWYLDDGDLVWVKRHKTRGNALSTEEFQGKVVLQGDDWDNDTEDGEQRQFIFEAASPFAREVYSGGTGKPHRDRSGTGFLGIFASEADTRITDVAHAPESGDSIFSTATGTYWQHNGTAFINTTSASPP